MTDDDSLFSPMFFRLFIPYGFSFFIGMFVGSINSILAPAIIADFSLTPADLGFISSVNLIAFGLAQFPLGVFLDAAGAKKTLSVMLLIAFFGVLLFAFAKSATVLLASRALTGVGFSAALMASFKAYTHFLPRKKLAVTFSVQSLLGGLGFMGATRPVSIALQYVSWRTFILFCAGLVLFALVMLLLLAPRDEPLRAPCDKEPLIKVFAEMLKFAKDKRFIYVAPVVTATEAVLFSFAYLWIGPWLRDVAMLDERRTGSALLLSSAGIAAGYLLNGVLADFFARKKWLTWEKLYLYSGVIFTAAIGVLAFFGSARTAPLWALVMFLSTMTMVSFPIIGRLFPVGETGRIFSLLNFVIFFAACAAQWLVGVVLSAYPVTGGHFSPLGYRTGLIAIFITNAAAVAHLYISLPKMEKLDKY